MRGSYFQALHLVLALKAGEPTRVALGLANYGAFNAIEGAPAERRASEIVEQAHALAVRLDAPRAMGRAVMGRASVAFLNGRFRDAILGFDDALATFRGRCTGVTWERSGTEFWTRLALYFTGDLAELGRRSQEHLEDAEARGDRYALSGLGASAMVVRHLCGRRRARRARRCGTPSRAGRPRASTCCISSPCGTRRSPPSTSVNPRRRRASSRPRGRKAERALLLRIQISRDHRSTTCAAPRASAWPLRRAAPSAIAPSRRRTARRRSSTNKAVTHATALGAPRPRGRVGACAATRAARPRCSRPRRRGSTRARHGGLRGRCAASPRRSRRSRRCCIATTARDFRSCRGWCARPTPAAPRGRPRPRALVRRRGAGVLSLTGSRRVRSLPIAIASPRRIRSRDDAGAGRRGCCRCLPRWRVAR